MDDFTAVFGVLPTAKKGNGEWHPKLHTRPRPEPEKPLAVALCIVHQRCSGCGSIYTYPSKHLLEKYHCHVHSTEWLRTFNTAADYPPEMKFEVIHHDSKSSNCLSCFQPLVDARERKEEAAPSERDAVCSARGGEEPVSE